MEKQEFEILCKQTLAEKIRNNISFLKSLTDLECMVWAREGDKLRASTNKDILYIYYSKMGDPVYDRINQIFGETIMEGDPSDAGTYTNLMEMFEFRKINQRVYEMILNRPLVELKEIFNQSH
jgi:hypothetical protein